MIKYTNKDLGGKKLVMAQETRAFSQHPIQQQSSLAKLMRFVNETVKKYGWE